MKRLLRDNGLSLVLLVTFLVIFGVGQTLTGWRSFNEEQRDHGEPTVGFGAYLHSAHFGEATFENWESEFLQMGAYVLLTVWLVQKGSAESKPLDESDPSEEPPERHRADPNAPWPVRRGGAVLWLYKNSLRLAFISLFAASWTLHAVTGAHNYSAEQLAHGGQAVDTWHYVRRAQFWFESLQNWQSEFLAVFSVVVLSIFLRQQGSPESKPVHVPHAETGTG